MAGLTGSQKALVHRGGAAIEADSTAAQEGSDLEANRCAGHRSGTSVAPGSALVAAAAADSVAASAGGETSGQAAHRRQDAGRLSRIPLSGFGHELAAQRAAFGSLAAI